MALELSVIAAISFLAWAIVVTCVSNRQAIDYEALHDDCLSLEADNEDLHARNEALKASTREAIKSVEKERDELRASLDSYIGKQQEQIRGLESDNMQIVKESNERHAKIANQQAIIDDLTEKNDRLLTENHRLTMLLEEQPKTEAFITTGVATNASDAVKFQWPWSKK